MIKLEYFGKKENQPGPCDIFIKVEYSNGAFINEELKHILRHSPDGFNMGYAGSAPADLALSILTDFCKRKNIDNNIVEKLYQKFKFDFIADCGNELSIRCIEIAEWIIKKEPELKNKLFKENEC